MKFRQGMSFYKGLYHGSFIPPYIVTNKTFQILKTVFHLIHIGEAHSLNPVWEPDTLRGSV